MLPNGITGDATNLLGALTELIKKNSQSNNTLDILKDKEMQEIFEQLYGKKYNLMDEESKEFLAIIESLKNNPNQISNVLDKIQLIKDKKKEAREKKDFYNELLKQTEKIEKELHDHPEIPNGIEKYLEKVKKEIDEIDITEFINPEHIKKFSDPDLVKNTVPENINRLISNFSGIFNKEKITNNDISNANQILNEIIEKCEDGQKLKIGGGTAKILRDIKKLAEESKPKINTTEYDKIINILEPNNIEQITTLYKDKPLTIFESIIENIKATINLFFLGVKEENPDTHALNKKISILVKSIQDKKFGNIKRDVHSVLHEIEDIKKQIMEDKVIPKEERQLRVARLELIEKKLKNLESINLGKIINRETGAKLSAMVRMDKDGLPELYKVVFGDDTSDNLILINSIRKYRKPTFRERIESLKIQMGKAQNNNKIQFAVRIIELEEKEEKLQLLNSFIEAKKQEDVLQGEEKDQAKAKTKSIEQQINSTGGRIPEFLIKKFIDSCQSDMDKNEGYMFGGLENAINQLNAQLKEIELKIEGIAAGDDDAINAKTKKLLEMKEMLKKIIPDSQKQEMQNEIKKLEEEKEVNSNIIDKNKKSALENIKKHIENKIKRFEELKKEWGGDIYNKKKKPNGATLKDLLKIEEVNKYGKSKEF